MNKKLMITGVLIILVLVAILAIRFFLGGDEDTWICTGGEWVKHGQPSAPQPVGGCGEASVAEEASPAGVGLANPASVYCEESGGRVRMEAGPEGERGICVFPDGTECDEWLFFRGECGAKTE